MATKKKKVSGLQYDMKMALAVAVAALQQVVDENTASMDVLADCRDALSIAKKVR